MSLRLNRRFIGRNTERLWKKRVEETRIYGKNSCQVLFKKRPKSIVHAWFTHNGISCFKKTLHWLAMNHKAYHIVSDLELSKISGTKHHGGVCFIIKRRNGIPIHQWVGQKKIDDCMVAIENISNPHNLGAIVRTCAHFNVKGILLQDTSLLESGSAVRTAEGGTEYVQPIIGNDIIEDLKFLQKVKYTIVATSSRRGKSLFKTKLPQKMVLVMGHECNGLSDAVLSLSDLKISIFGTGNISSLNVSVATSILLAEWWRQNKR